jgi:hypothetical protein
LKLKRKIALLQWATPAVVLGPTGENGLAHLGLWARSAETGERPHSPPARGSLAGKGGAKELTPEVRVPIWAIGGRGAHRGGLAAAKQIGGGEPVTVVRRRGGEH